uniref:Uncharacterized protein n=1 Tax=Meloidogyne floridensis TaxID=298350 RepID=A0A915NPP5_9BILA
MSKFFFIVAILIFVFIEIDAGVKRKHNEVVSNDNKPPKRSRKQGTPQQAWTGHLGHTGPGVSMPIAKSVKTTTDEAKEEKVQNGQNVRIPEKQNEKEIPDDILLSSYIEGSKLNKTDLLNKKKNKILEDDALNGIKKLYASDADKIGTPVIKSAEKFLDNEAIYV